MGTNAERFKGALRELRAAVVEERGTRRDHMRGDVRESFTVYERAKMRAATARARVEQMLVDDELLIEGLGPDGGNGPSGGTSGPSRDGAGPSPRSSLFDIALAEDCPRCSSVAGDECREDQPGGYVMIPTHPHPERWVAALDKRL